MSSLRTCEQKTQRKGTVSKPCVVIPRYLWKMKVEKCKQNILLHKYGHIYLSKVFRNVRPSEATRHYETQLLKGAFRRWKLLWWQQRQQWRLTLRANCYHRFILLKQSFAAWREYIGRKQAARQREVQAKQHYERRVLTRSLNCFKQNSQLCKNLKINASIGLEILMIVNTKQDRLHSMLKIITQRVDELAWALWKNKSVKRYWALWMKYSQLQKIKKGKLTSALEMYRSKLLQMTFKKWQKYIEMKKTKHKVLKIADETYVENLLSTYLLTWNERYQHVTREKQLSKTVRELFNHKMLHSCFLAWSIFAKERTKARLADEHHTRAMKEWDEAPPGHSSPGPDEGVVVITSWLSTTATGFKSKYHNRVISPYLTHISRTVDTIEETRTLKCLKEYADYMIKRRLARERMILKRAWSLWTAAVEQSQLQQVWPQVEMARSFYRKKLLENSLRTLKAYADKRKKKTKLRIKAEMLLYLQYVQLWYNQWQEKQYIACLEKQAVAFHQLMCLKRTLSTWEERYHQALYLKELQENANHYYIYNLVKKCFSAWKTWAVNCVQTRMLKEEVYVLHCHRVQKMYFHFWRLVTREKRSKRMKMLIARQHYKQSLIRKVWASWKMFYRRKRSEAERMRTLRAKLWKGKLRRILARWLLYKNEMLRRKKTMDVSVQHYNLAIVIKAWDGWLYYMEYRQQKRSSKRKYQQPADQLKAVMMTSYFHSWFEQTGKLQRAKRHHNERLMRRCLRRWHEDCLEQAALKQREERLRLVSEGMVFMRCLKVWRFRLAQRLEVKRQEVVALVFWSNKLQRKCLKRWLDYVHQQREQIKRYMDALETQRASLLQEGFKAWMRADLVAAEERETSALEYVTRRTRREFHIASKYFARWKLKVRKKKKTLQYVGHRYDNDTRGLLTMGDMQRMYKTVLDTPILRAACDQIADKRQTYPHDVAPLPPQPGRVLDTLHLNRKRPPPRIPLFMTTKPNTKDNSNNDLAVQYNTKL